MTQPHAGPSADARTTHAALIEEAKAARRHCDHTRRTCKEVGCDYDLIDRLATALAASERALRAAHDGDRRYAALEQANTKLAGLLDAANGTIAQLRAEREARDEAAASDSKLLDDIEAMPGMEVSQHLGNHTGVVHWRFGSTRGSLRDRVRAALDLATPTPEADHA